MDKQTPHIDPVAPTGMDLAFHYSCPFCHRMIRVSSPTKPALIACPECHGHFPIVPVDETFLNFIRIMTADGRAAVNTEYL